MLYICVPVRRKKCEKTGEYRFATLLEGELQKLGHQTELVLADDIAPQPVPGSAALHICGASINLPITGIPNLLWLVSSPHLLTWPLARAYQHLFVASAFFAERLKELGLTHVSYLPQCTDPDIFTPPDPAAPRERDFFFAGNLRNDFRRTTVESLLRLGAEIEIVGQGWRSAYPDAGVRQRWIDTDQLAGKYRASRFVLDHHEPAMLRYGFLNHRVYDALACGARVISDQAAIPPELAAAVMVVNPRRMTADVIREALSLPDRTPAEIEETRQVLARDYSFKTAAKVISEQASALVARASCHRRPLEGLDTAVGPFAATNQAEPRLYVTDDRGLHQELVEKAGSWKLWDGGAQDSDLLVAAHDLSAAMEAMPERQAVVMLTPTGRAKMQPGSFEDQEAMLIVPRLNMIGALTTDAKLRSRLRFATVGTRNETSGLMQAAAEILESWPKAPIAHFTYVVETLHQALLTGQSVPPQVLAVLEGAMLRFDPEGRLPPTDMNGMKIVRASASNGRYLLGRSDVQHDSAEAASEWHQPNGRSEGTGPQSPEDFVVLAPRERTPRFAGEIGVFLHIFHVEAATRLRQVIDRLPTARRIYISTDREEKVGIIAKAFEADMASQRAEIKVFPNCGRDVFPKLFGWIEEHRRHPFVLHMHSKKSAHLTDTELSWFDDLEQCLAPDAGTVNAIIAAFKNAPGLGMFGPRPFPKVAGSIRWGHNIWQGRELLRRMDLPQALAEEPVRFPAGSMFWARPEALEPLFALNLTAADFPAESGQLDGTVAHALERCLALSTMRAGLRYLEIGPSSEGQELVDIAGIRGLIKDRVASTPN